MSEAIIYKYLPPVWSNGRTGPIDPVEEVLERRLLRFTQPTEMNDHFENFPNAVAYKRSIRDENFRLRLSGIDASDANIDPHFEKIITLIQDCYVYLCLSGNKSSQTMWSQYSMSHTGFAVGFDSRCALFHPETETSGIALRPVQYSSKRVNYPVDGTFTLTVQDQRRVIESVFFTKSEELRYEVEARVARRPSDAQAVVESEHGAPLFKFGFHPADIKEVILGCRIAPDKRKRITEVLRRDYPHVRLYETSLDDLEFKMQVTLLDNRL